MRFTFEGTDTWTEKQELFGEIALKMYAIRDNIKFIYETLEKQYPKDEVLKENGVDNLAYNTQNIVVDLENANDEFYLEHENGTEYVTVEVVTREVAEENDREFLRDIHYTEEDRDSYVLGEVMSDYTKLGGTEYYFKFM